ncbi:hypothetical protein NDU88_000217 [Pleurodeles waltl]|uniref:Uncharacterized protein n=1 Tax=Pleurodeles waltl TaxID=8319 RepID=A0AAV7KMG3_PLEWA|nr:hypothetical protein NDU88_000217 [Pleurodeles waltl]
MIARGPYGRAAVHLTTMPRRSLYLVLDELSLCLVHIHAARSSGSALQHDPMRRETATQSKMALKKELSQLFRHIGITYCSDCTLKTIKFLLFFALPPEAKAQFKIAYVTYKDRNAFQLGKLNISGTERGLPA